MAPLELQRFRWVVPLGNQIGCTLGTSYMARNRVLVQFPPELIAEVDRIAGHGKRTAYLVELAKREVKLHRQREALREAAGSWKPEDHPELTGGSAAWVRQIRDQDQDQDQERLRRLDAQRQSVR